MKEKCSLYVKFMFKKKIHEKILQTNIRFYFLEKIKSLS